jgi:hypothetical protein
MHIIDDNLLIYVTFAEIYPIKMLKNKNEFKSLSVNPIGNRLNWSSTQEKNQRDPQTETLLFDDGHVEIVCRFAENDLQYCPANF